ncbi:MAG: hypothetical protein NXI15_06335 [Gammaproteobacteria bacterium]|nr:hypothetical protein [Gammaproteobacteria bacterium]
MCRMLFAAVLLASANVSMAFEWPGSATEVEQVEYCKGLLTAGLSSRVPQGDQRTELWLGWNRLVRDAGVGYEKHPEQFLAGREAFAAADSQDVVEQLLEAGRRECGLGLSGVRVTGF